MSLNKQWKGKEVMMGAIKKMEVNGIGSEIGKASWKIRGRKKRLNYCIYYE